MQALCERLDRMFRIALRAFLLSVERFNAQQVHEPADVPAADRITLGLSGGRAASVRRQRGALNAACQSGASVPDPLAKWEPNVVERTAGRRHHFGLAS